MTAPEAQARAEIDRLLTAAGWRVCDFKAADIHASRGVAIREFELKAGHGTADMSHLGKCVVIPDALRGALFESNMMRFRLVPGVLPRYVELYLGSRIGKRRLTANAKWAVNQASINQKDVQATKLPTPCLESQSSIVSEVDRSLSIVREVEAEVHVNLRRARVLRQTMLARAFEGDADGLD